MIIIPIYVFVILIILGVIGLVHLIAYAFLLIGGIVAYRENQKIDKTVECPYFIERNENERE